jgi:outer membrane protein assembly factor BamB
MRIRSNRTVRWFGVVVLVTALTVPSVAADWPNFLGPRYDGKSDEKGFKTNWTEPLKLVWERNVGSAFSSFACVGNRVYTCGAQDKQQVLYCLNADTGEVIWQKPFEKEYRNEHGDGTRATPTVNDGRVYILGANGRLLCVDAENGSQVWEKQFTHMPTWAYAGSVLIEGDLAIASAGKDDGALVAFNKKTGEPVWKCGDDPVGYSTPYPFTFNGQRYIVGFMGNSALIAEAKTGREVWRMPWKTDWDVNAASPIFSDGYLFLTSGYTTGCALLKLAADGDKLASTTVWKSDVLMNKFQSCILQEGKLYGSDQNALKCVDFLTGQEHWKKPRMRNGTLILADGYFLFLTEGGQLQIAKPSTEDFAPLSTAEILTGRCWSVSVLNNGRLFARNLDRVVCFDLRR